MATARTSTQNWPTVVSQMSEIEESSWRRMAVERTCLHLGSVERTCLH